MHPPFLSFYMADRIFMADRPNVVYPSFLLHAREAEPATRVRHGAVSVRRGRPGVSSLIQRDGVLHEESVIKRLVPRGRGLYLGVRSPRHLGGGGAQPLQARGLRIKIEKSKFFLENDKVF